MDVDFQLRGRTLVEVGVGRTLAHRTHLHLAQTLQLLLDGLQHLRGEQRLHFGTAVGVGHADDAAVLDDLRGGASTSLRMLIRITL